MLNDKRSNFATCSSSGMKTAYTLNYCNAFQPLDVLTP